MNKNKLLKQIRDTYSEDGGGLKKLKRQKRATLFVLAIFMFIVFQLDVFNFENIIGVFSFIVINAFLMAFHANLNSSIYTYDVVKEVVDFNKIDKLLEEEDNEQSNS